MVLPVAQEVQYSFGTDVQITSITPDMIPPPVPTLPDVTGECSVTVPVATTIDPCAGMIEGTTSDPLFYDIPGMFMITWSFDDGNGNVSMSNQNVIVNDNGSCLVIPTLSQWGTILLALILLVVSMIAFDSFSNIQQTGINIHW